MLSCNEVSLFLNHSITSIKCVNIPLIISTVSNVHAIFLQYVRTEVKCSSSPESLFAVDLKQHNFPLGGALELSVCYPCAKKTSSGDLKQKFVALSSRTHLSQQASVSELEMGYRAK